MDWNQHNHVKVPVSAQWTDLSVTARDLLNLKPGDINRWIPNDWAKWKYSGDHPKYTGRWAAGPEGRVQITNILNLTETHTMAEEDIQETTPNPSRRTTAVAEPPFLRVG